MPADEDKYPAESDRRRFVKGVVGASALGTVGVSSAAAINSATTAPGAGGGTIQFMGIENIDGPAPRAMPQIPLKITDDGVLQGIWPETETQEIDGQEVTVAEMNIGGRTYSSEWFQYCGLQGYTGIQPDADQDNAFRSVESPPAAYEWQSDLSAGEPLTRDMFDDYESWGNEIGKSGLGKPAMGTWRSQDVSPQNTITIQVLRSTQIKDLAQDDPWLSETTTDGFIAWLNKCTHFCCVPGYKAYADSASFGAENEVYCQCHQSVYDPFSVVQRQFTALPRPEDAGGGSGSGSGG